MKSFHLSVITLQSDKSFRHKHPVLVRPCLHFKYLLKPMKLSIAWENFIRPSLSPSTEVLIKLLHKTWCHLSMSHIKRHQMNATIASFRKWFAKMTWTLQSRYRLSKEKIAKERKGYGLFYKTKKPLYRRYLWSKRCCDNVWYKQSWICCCLWSKWQYWIWIVNQWYDVQRFVRRNFATFQ